jgi:multimeric flavodoxin WrbA
MKGVYASLADADVIVAATPLYFYGVSSQLKSLIDRLHNPIRNSFKVKKLVLLAVGADTKKEVFDSLVTAYKAVLKYFSLENGGIITVNGMKNKGDIRKDAALDAARELASSL